MHTILACITINVFPDNKNKHNKKPQKTQVVSKVTNIISVNDYLKYIPTPHS